VLQLRDVLSPFYKKSAIHVVTEGQIKAGEETIDLERLQADKDREDALHFTRNKYIHRSRDDPEHWKNNCVEDGKPQVPSFMIASILDPDLKKTTGLKTKGERAGLR